MQDLDEAVARIGPVPVRSSQKRLIFRPCFNDGQYVVKSTRNVSAQNWEPLSNAIFSNSGPERTVTDLDATGGMKFYRVEIRKP